MVRIQFLIVLHTHYNIVTHQSTYEGIKGEGVFVILNAFEIVRYYRDIV